MKKITTFLGCVGVVCLISGCSSDSDDLEKIVLPSQPTANVASSSNSNSSISSATAATSNSSNSGASNPTSSGNQSTDSPSDTVHKEVVIKSEPGDYPDPYFSSGVFCWSEECEKEWAGKSSASAPKSSSSMTIDIGMSVEAPVYPTVTETQMIDARDNNSYTLIRIGNTHWMNENLKYRPSSGVYCEHEGQDVCATYGGFYTYGRAQAICPAGWRLPTMEEVDAANKTQPHEWWTVGGRFKIDNEESPEYGLAKEQGYIWIIQSESYTSFRVKDYSGDTEHTFQSSEGSRAYNVRCVEGE